MKFGNIRDWESDAALELEGVPFDIGRERVITIRRAGGANRDFVVAYAALIRSILGDRDPAALDDAAQRELNDELGRRLPPLFADHVVLGWSGFLDETGDPVRYTKAAFLELVAAAPDLWTRLRAQADTRERFQREQIERDKVRISKSSRFKRNGGSSAHA
jgi:hypothetical protein